MAKETILVIDSDTETAQQMVMTLEEEDYLVFTAPSGGMGIAMAKKVNPSLIYLNIASGGGSGLLEVCTELRGIEHLKDVPIVVLSSFEGASDPRYASEYGIVDTLGRSFSDQELIAKTRKALSPKKEAVESAADEKRDTGSVVESEREEWATPGHTEDGSGALSFSATGAGEEPSRHVVGGEREDEGRDSRDYSYGEDETLNEQQGAPLRGKGRSRTRKRGKAPSFAFIAVLVILVVVAATVIFSYKNILSWISETPQGPASQRVVTQKKGAEPVPAREQQPPVQAQEEKVPALEAKPSVPEAKPVQQSGVEKAVPKADGAKSDAIKYAVQLGAFKNEHNAEALAKQYKEKGYDAFVLRGPTDKETLHRVLVGRFEDMRRASAMAAEISAKEHIRVTVFKGYGSKSQ